MFKHRVTIRMGEVLGNPLTIIGLSTSCIDLMAVKITNELNYRPRAYSQVRAFLCFRYFFER